MGWNTFFNYEIVAIQIIKDCIDKLFDLSEIDHNYGKYKPNDILAIENNIKYGSIAIVFILDLFETSLNTIVGRRMGFDDIYILESSLSTKLALICKSYDVKLNYIKSLSCYSSLKELKKVRNSFVHFKKNHVGQGVSLTGQFRVPLGNSKVLLVDLVNKDRIEKYYNDVSELINKLCDCCGLYVCSDVEMIDSDARSDTCEFIVGGNKY